jgi:hypothetical protein
MSLHHPCNSLTLFAERNFRKRYLTRYHWSIKVVLVGEVKASGTSSKGTWLRYMKTSLFPNTPPDGLGNERWEYDDGTENAMDDERTKCFLPLRGF